MQKTIITVKVEKNDFDSLKIIRNYFGTNDKTMLEHLAFSVLDRIIKENEQTGG